MLCYVENYVEKKIIRQTIKQHICPTEQNISIAVAKETSVDK